MKDLDELSDSVVQTAPGGPIEKLYTQNVVEALRAELQTAKQDVVHWKHEAGIYKAEIERLREALERISGQDCWESSLECVQIAEVALGKP